MSQTQTRKQKILGDVKKKRRQRAIISISIVVVLIGIVVTAIVLLPRGPGSNFPFQCLGYEVTTLHVHPYVQIFISGQSVPIPAAVGIASPTYSGGQVTGGSCFEPIHTHDASGIIHVEASDVNSPYTLGDFFKVWAATYGSVIINSTPHPIVFNNTDLLGFTAGSGNRVTMKVDGTNSTSTDFASSIVLRMYDYCSSSNGAVPPCSLTANGDPYYGGGPNPYGTGHTIVINYGP